MTYKLLKPTQPCKKSYKIVTNFIIAHSAEFRHDEVTLQTKTILAAINHLFLTGFMQQRITLAE